MNTVNMFKDYLADKIGAEFILDQNGFAMYVMEEDYILISDMYIKKEFRGTGLTTTFIEQLEDMARINGVKYLMCECQLNDGCPQEAVSAIIKLFKPVKANDDMITFVREVI